MLGYALQVMGQLIKLENGYTITRRKVLESSSTRFARFRAYDLRLDLFRVLLEYRLPYI